MLESAFSARDIPLDPNPAREEWADAPRVFARVDRAGQPIPGPATEIRSRWTREHLYLLYICPYTELNLKPDPQPAVETSRLWNWDVAEAFIGSDFEHIGRYKELQVSPQSEWVDLEIDRENPKEQQGARWNSGYQVKGRIDEQAHVWYGMMRIPFAAIDTRLARKGPGVAHRSFSNQWRKPETTPHLAGDRRHHVSRAKGLRYASAALRTPEMHQMRVALFLLAAVVASLSGPPAAQSAPRRNYDLLLKGGHVIDSRNNLSAVRDVAIKDGKVAAVAADIPAAQAFKTVDVKGLYVTPGLIDIHAHTYRPTYGRGFTAENQAVYPDGFSFRNGVTTFVDPGGSGWRNFEDMKDKIIDRSRTRVFAMINIVGLGQAGGKYEQDLNDMEVKPTAEMALKYKGIIVGVKSAHYAGPEWDPFTRAVEVGKIANIPVMVDFGSNRPERPLYDLLNKVFRPGDIFTHVYGGNRGEQDPKTLGPSQALIDGRKRGVLFDVGHGGGSFRWRVAVPLMKAGFLPDTMSTDLHTRSMNAGLKDILNLMSKFLAMGMPLDKVIAANTWNAARAIKQEQLGHLSVGAAADVAVLRVEKGSFGFTDQHGARLKGTERLRCELTLRDGKVVYDLNNLTGEDWDKLPADYRGLGDPRWDGMTEGGGGRGGGRRAWRGNRPRRGALAKDVRSLTPRPISSAAFIPARMRSERTSLANCANAASTPSISLPVDVRWSSSCTSGQFLDDVLPALRGVPTPQSQSSVAGDRQDGESARLMPSPGCQVSSGNSDLIR